MLAFSNSIDESDEMPVSVSAGWGAIGSAISVPGGAPTGERLDLTRRLWRGGVVLEPIGHALLSRPE